MSYLNQSKPELQDLARDRGLPVSGTKEEIAARLEVWDQDHADQPADEPVVEPATEPEQVPTEPTPPQEELAVATPSTQVQMPGRPPTDPSRVFRIEYPVSGTMFDHEALVRQTYEKAVAAGRTPRGGGNAITSAHRVGFGTDGQGNQTAIYEISVRSDAEQG